MNAPAVSAPEKPARRPKHLLEWHTPEWIEVSGWTPNALAPILGITPQQVAYRIRENAFNGRDRAIIAAIIGLYSPAVMIYSPKISECFHLLETLVSPMSADTDGIKQHVAVTFTQDETDKPDQTENAAEEPEPDTEEISDSVGPVIREAPSPPVRNEPETVPLPEPSKPSRSLFGVAEPEPLSSGTPDMHVDVDTETSPLEPVDTTDSGFDEEPF